MLSDNAQIGACVGIAALLQTGSSAVGFLGTFRDDNKLQSKLMDKNDIDEGAALKKVSWRRKWQRGVLILMWFASIIFSGLAVAVILAS